METLREVAVELHDCLNIKIWDEENNLRPIVRDRLLQITKQYAEDSEVLNYNDILDAEIVGSNASYNYTSQSDLDLHLVVNMENLSCDPALFQLACNAEKINFNKYYDIKVKGIDVELYVEDVKSCTASNGIYSVFKDEWIKFPAKIEVPSFEDDAGYNTLLSEYKTKAEALLEPDTSAEDIDNYINSLYTLRRSGIMTDGEFSQGNFIFKEIRNLGLLDALKDMLKDIRSKELSVESLLVSNESVNPKKCGEESKVMSDEFVYDTDMSTEEVDEAFRNIDAKRSVLWEGSMSMLRNDLQKGKKPIIESKKYRVNYLLNESYHYSIVEAANEDDAETQVKKYLDNPDRKIVTLGVEEQEGSMLEPGSDSAMAEIINQLIVDEWEAISGYNSASVTAQQIGAEDAAKLFADIAREEAAHVGELQQLLKSVDENTHAISEGEEEAQQKLDESVESDYRVMQKSYKNSQSFKDIDKESGEFRDLTDDLKHKNIPYDIYYNKQDKGATVFYESVSNLDRLSETDRAKVITVVDETYNKTVEELIEQIQDGKFDSLKYEIREPNGIEFFNMDMSNGKGEVIYHYFLMPQNGDIIVYVDVK